MLPGSGADGRTSAAAGRASNGASAADVLDDDGRSLFLPPSARCLEPVSLARANLDFARGDALLHRLASMQDLLAVAFGKHGDDRVLLDDRVERFAELLNRDQRLRLAEHGVERSNGPAPVFCVTERLVEAVAQGLVILLLAGLHQLAKPLYGAVRDAVSAVADEGGAHGLAV